MRKRNKMEKNLSDDEQKGANSSASPASSSLAVRCSARISEKTTADSQFIPVEEGPINGLPAEMVTLILKNLGSPSLLQCRLVNRQWREISSRILSTRQTFQTTISISLDSNKFGLWGAGGGTKSLKNFVSCLQNSKSKNCPFSHFELYIRQSQDFDDKDVKDFLSLFSALQFKSLRLNLNTPENITELQIWVEKLRTLLLKETPHLEKFELDWEPIFQFRPDAAQVKLFPDKKPTGAAGFGAREFELPHLKVLHFHQGMISAYQGISRDISNAATNLERICARIETPEHYRFLESFGKLHLVKELHLCLTLEFNWFMYHQKGDITWRLPLPDLEVLKLSRTCACDDDYKSTAGNFLFNVVKSCKDNLKELTLRNTLSLYNVQLPTLKNLRKLIIKSGGEPIFPSGTSSRDIFPAVDSLELRVGDWSKAFPQPDSIPVLPSVKTLCFSTRYRNWENDFSKVALMCPNLSKLEFSKDDSYTEYGGLKWLDFVDVCQSIWTHMARLESLKIAVDVGRPEERPFVLDSCFTGISRRNCVQLDKMEKARQRKSKRGITLEIPESKLKALTQREQPSILDMKELKELTINAYSKGKLQNKKEFFSKLTWISQEYAFKLMPNLQLDRGDSE